MKVEESIIINRSCDEVFAFFNDRGNDERWMASVVESEWLDRDMPTGLGRRRRMVMDAMGRREFVDEVTAFELEHLPGGVLGKKSVHADILADRSPQLQG